MNEEFRFSLESTSLDSCTIGKLFVINNTTKTKTCLFYTMERKWKANEPYLSCVPAGEYIIKPHNSPKHGLSYYLESFDKGVVGLTEGKRTHIVIHCANMASELEGCISLGSASGILQGEHGNELAVLNSKKSVEDFNIYCDGYDFRLTIKRV